jgi:hypothetical protein
MHEVSDYRKKAEQCRRLARFAGDDLIAEALIQAAKYFDEKALEAESKPADGGGALTRNALAC